MNIRNLVRNKKNFSFHLNEKLDIEAISYDLYSNGGKALINKNIEVVLRSLFCNAEFCNEGYIEYLLTTVRDVFNTKKTEVDQIIVSDQNLKASFYYSFSLDIEIVMIETAKIVLKFNDFKEAFVKEDFYVKLFKDMEGEFGVFSRIEKISRFVIDYSYEKPQVYGDDNFPVLLNMKKSETNCYQLSDSDSEDSVIRLDFFLKGIKLLESNELSFYTEESLIEHTWIKCDIKVLKRDDQGNCMLIVGVIYDISNSNKYKDIEYLYTIYELAITSGGIGIFHYNLENHSKEYFDCNIIYKRMLGLEQQENGYYLQTDFTKCLLPLEDEISDNTSVLKSLSNVFKGNIEGTNDDILKIKNLQTNEIKYLLSSSKIDLKYEDGTPKRFGGIVIDITDRIVKEKKQIIFAYVDELTRLSNNRRLYKDLKNKTSDIGLFFDLDNFKKINDEFGHLFGDQVLRIYGDSLSEISKKYENVTPYRLYGDEFFVFAEGNKENFASKFHEELNEAVTKRINDLKPGIKVAASMGYSVLDDSRDFDEFVKLADYAMYKEKIKGRDKNYK